MQLLRGSRSAYAVGQEVSHNRLPSSDCSRSHHQTYRPIAITWHRRSLPLGSCFIQVKQSLVYGLPTNTSCVNTALRGKIPLATTFSRVVAGSATKNVSTNPRWARVQHT